MKSKEDKQKIVEELFDTFDDRNELQEAWKAMLRENELQEILKAMLRDFVKCNSTFISKCPIWKSWDLETQNRKMDLFIDRFIESRFKKRG